MRRVLPLLLALFVLPTLAWSQAQVINGNRVHAGWINYGMTAGTATAYTLTFTPALQGYVTGQCFLVKPHLANTGAATLNVQGLGAKPLGTLQGSSLVPLVAGDLRVNRLMQVCYDGTTMQLMGPAPDAGDAAAHGIVCDGVTMVSAAIQALLDTAPLGTRLVLPPGVCLLNQTLVIHRAMSLEGAGPTHTRLRQTVADIAVVSIWEATDVQVRGLTVEHSGTPVAGGDGMVANYPWGIQHVFLENIAAKANWRGFVLGCVALAYGTRLEAVNNNSHGFEFAYRTACGTAQWQVTDSLSQLNKGAGFYGLNVESPSGIGPFLQFPVTFANEEGGYVFLGTPGFPISDILLRSVLSSVDNHFGIYMDTYGPNHMIDNPWVEVSGGSSGFPVGTPPVTSVARNTGNCIRITANNWPGLVIHGGRLVNCSWSGLATYAPYSGITGAYFIGNGRALHGDIGNRSAVYIAAEGVEVSGNTFGFTDGNTVAGSTLSYITFQGSFSHVALGQNTYAPGIAVVNIVSTSGATFTNVIPPVMAMGLLAHSNSPGARGLMVIDTTGAPNYVKSLRVANGQLEVLGMPGTVISRLSEEGTPGWPNRRGSVVIADAAMTATVTLSPAEPDTDYFVQLTVSSSVGPTPAGALAVAGVTKAAGSFVVTVSAAPGAGKSITYDWFVYR